MAAYDLRNCTFDEFITYFFDHPVEEEKWHWDDDLSVQYDVDLHARYFTELFNNSQFLVGRYSREYLEQGFWSMLCETVPGSVMEVIFDSSISFARREECVRSMFFLYRDFFAVDSLLHAACSMWWDFLAEDYSHDFRFRNSSDEDRVMQDVMFETLTQILQLDNEACQGAALHGMGHLRHPNTKAVIRSWISTQPNLSEEDLKYAEACIRGEVT